MIKKFKLIVLVAPSSAGKDEIQKELINRGYQNIVSITSRPMRVGETNGIEYIFVSYEQAKRILNEGGFVEHRIYNTIQGDWIYGITKESIRVAIASNKPHVVIVDAQGLIELEKYMKKIGMEESLISIYVNVNAQTRLLRSLNREGNMSDKQVEEVIRRFQDDKEKVCPYIYHCDYAFKNENVEDLSRILKLIDTLINM